MKKARTAGLNIRIASRTRVLERRETRRSQDAIQTAIILCARSRAERGCSI